MRLKKIIPLVLLTALVLLVALSFTACGGTVYKVDFYVDGELYQSFTVSKGGFIEDVPEVPAREGKIGKWNRNDFDEINSDIKVHAVYSEGTYTVTFVADGAVLDAIRVNANSVLDDVPEVPAKEGFVGSWSIEDFSTIDRDITVYALYTEIDEVISFYDSEGGKLLYTRYVKIGQDLTDIPAVPTYIGKELTGRWVDADGNIPSFSHITGDMALYADYYATVTLSVDGTEKEVPCELDEDVGVFSAGTKEGYDFFGWYFDEEYRTAVTFPHRFDANVTLYCRWISNIGDDNFIFEGNTVLGYIGEEKNITVPYKYHKGGVDIVVTAIAEDAFLDSDIESITLPSTIVEIGNNSFKNCIYLESINYPDGNYVERIGDNAFYGCKVMSSFPISPYLNTLGEYAFFGCSSVTAYDGLHLSELALVPDYAFAGNDSLVSVSLPVSLTTIGAHSFDGVKKATFTFPTDNVVTAVGEYAFADCFALRSFLAKNISTVGEYAFSGCNSLAEVSLPSDVLAYTVFGSAEGVYFYEVSGRYVPSMLQSIYITEGKEGVIAEEAYFNLVSVKKFEISKNVKTIGKQSFGLDVTPTEGKAEVIFGESVSLIREYAFYNRADIKEISIPASVKEIERYAFFGCTEVEKVTVAQNGELTFVGEDAFVDTKWFVDGVGVIKTGRVVIGITEKYLNSIGKTSLVAEDFAGADTIAPYAFRGNTILRSVVIPANIYRIYNGAFADCTALTEAILSPDTNIGLEVTEGEVTTVTNEIFDGCVTLTRLSYNLDTNLEDYFGATEEVGFTLFKGKYVPDTLAEITLHVGAEPIVEAEVFDGLNTVKKVILTDGFTTIADGAFLDTSIESIVLPDTLVSIGSQGERYSSRTDLTYLGTFPTTLNTVIIGENSALTEIFDSAFRGTSIDSFVIPSAVEYVGKYAFADIDGADLSFSDNELLIIDEFAFSNTAFVENILAFPVGLTSIGKSAFEGAKGVEKVVFGTQITNIGEAAFKDSTLNEFDLPDTVEVSDGENILVKDILSGANVGKLTVRRELVIADLFGTVPAGLKTVTIYGNVAENALYGLADITSVTIIDTLVIGDNAFYGCSGLIRFTVPKTVTDIGTGAFSECSGLVTFIIEEGSELETIGDDLFKNDRKLMQANIPITVKNTVMKGTFYGCESLTGINPLPDGLKEVGEGAFYGCKALESIVIPKGIEKIGAQSFYGCEKLEISDIKFDYLTEIGERAFFGCARLSGIKGESVQTLGAEAFFGCSSLAELSIGAGALSDYTDVTSIGTLNVSLSALTFPEIGTVTVNNIMVHSDTAVNDILTGIAESSATSKVFVTVAGYELITSELKNGVLSGKIFTNPTYLDATYTYNDDLTATITSIGSYDGAVIYFPSYTVNGGVEYTVTAIGSDILRDNATVEEITLPSTIEVIEEGAFYNSSIETVLFETGSQLSDIEKEAFYNCDRLTSIKIPDKVISIGDRAFYGSGISSLVISGFARLKTIGSYAFYGCTDLTTVSINNTALNAIGSYAFHSSGLVSFAVNKDAPLSEIEEFTFAYCYNLAVENVTLPDGVVIHESAFAK